VEGGVDAPVFSLLFGGTCERDSFIPTLATLRESLILHSSIYDIKIEINMSIPSGKKKCVFVNSPLKIQRHIVKYTPTDCFYDDFSHWVTIFNEYKGFLEKKVSILIEFLLRFLLIIQFNPLSVKV